MKVQIQDCPREIANILRGVSGKGDRGHGPGVGEPRKYVVTLLSYSKWSFFSILQKHSKPEKKIKSKNKNVNSPFSKTRKLLSPESQTSGEGCHQQQSQRVGAHMGRRRQVPGRNYSRGRTQQWRKAHTTCTLFAKMRGRALGGRVRGPSWTIGLGRAQEAGPNKTPQAGYMCGTWCE